MSDADPRSRRIALVADDLFQGGETIVRLEAAGWGLVQLPPADLSSAALEAALGLALDQAEDYARHGHRLVLCLTPASEPLRAVVLAACQRRGMASPESL